MGNLVFNSKDSMQNLIKLVNEAAEAVGKVFGGGKGISDESDESEKISVVFGFGDFGGCLGFGRCLRL